jgi:hypothetical protein
MNRQLRPAWVIVVTFLFCLALVTLRSSGMVLNHGRRPLRESRFATPQVLDADLGLRYAQNGNSQ